VRPLLVVVVLAAYARADPCPYAPAYESALAAHRRRAVVLCRDPSSACDQANAAVAAVDAKLRACLAGEDVGPLDTMYAAPPSETPARERHTVEGVFEGLAGGGVALGNASWRDSVDPGPTFVARAGVVWRGWLGGLLAVEYSPAQLRDGNAMFPPGSGSESLNRVRFLANAVVELHQRAHLWWSFRAGIGLERGYYEYEVTSFGLHEQADATGLAIDLGATGWYSVGELLSVGAGLAMPFTIAESQSGNVAVPAATWGVELVLGIRLGAR
jgi:hypothetical protein